MNIFGLNIFSKEKKEEKIQPSPISPFDDESSISLNTSGFFGTYFDLNSTYNNESELIARYRDVSSYFDVDNAIEEITTEVIASVDSEVPVKIDTSEIESISEGTKKKIEEEFDNILVLLNFKKKGHDIFKRWYIDGRIYYQKIIDQSKRKEGIKKLVYIDPRKLKKVRDVKKEKLPSGIEVVKEIKEYYLYNDKGFGVKNTNAAVTNTSGINITLDIIATSNSGIYDYDKNLIQSYLHKAIKPVNQLKMMTDAMVIYRLARSAERRIFYIDVGNLPKTKAEDYMKSIMNKYRNKVVYDASTGTVKDNRHHMTMMEDYWLPRRCLSLDTKIKLLDGRDLSLNDIIKEYEEGNELWVYSCSDEGHVVPGKISWAGITRKDANVVRITLDNGENIISTPDHKFILRDGNLCEAQYLKENDSLMPLYEREKYITFNSNGKYPQIFDNENQEWIFTHRMVSEYFNGKTKSSEVIHHADFIKLNNNPDNLVIMDKKEHFALHSRCGTNSWKNGNVIEHKLNLSIASKAFYETEKGKERKREISEFNKNDERIQNALRKGRESIRNNQKLDKEILSEEEYYNKWHKTAVEARREGTEKRKIVSTSFDIQIIENIISDIFHSKIKIKDILEEVQKTYPNFKTKTFTKFVKLHGYESVLHYLKEIFGDEYKRSNQFYNHKVVKVEFLDERIDTGTLTIDENHEYHNYHNFALSCGIFVKNSDSRGTEITTLPGAQNLGNVEDINLLQNQVYNSLNVPTSRLHGEPNVLFGRQAEVSRDEMKFAKFVNRLRRKFNELFDDLLKTNLILKNIITEDDWIDIKEKINYKYTQDQYFQEVKEAEILRNRIELLNQVQPYVGTYFSVDYVNKNVLKLTDQDVKDIEKQNKENPPMLQSDGLPGSVQASALSNSIKGTTNK